MLNSIGLQNPGSRVVIDEILPSLDFTETRFFANLSGSTVEEYSACVSTKGSRITRTGMIWTAFRALSVLWNLTRSAGRVVAGYDRIHG